MTNDSVAVAVACDDAGGLSAGGIAAKLVSKTVAKELLLTFKGFGKTYTTGLEHIRFHDLRHTFATLALQNGIDVKTVSSMLGHSNAGFTLATYTHATSKAQEQAAAKMGNLLKQAL